MIKLRNLNKYYLILVPESSSLKNYKQKFELSKIPKRIGTIVSDIYADGLEHANIDEDFEE